jgi:hypothetical protein
VERPAGEQRWIDPVVDLRRDAVQIVGLAGGLAGVAVLVAVFGRAGSYASAQAFTDGFTAAIGACAALSLTGALAGLTVPGRRSAASRAPAQAAPPVQAGAGPRT